MLVKVSDPVTKPLHGYFSNICQEEIMTFRQLLGRSAVDNHTWTHPPTYLHI